MDDLADITSEVQRLMANATFVRSATRRGVERALSQTMHGPTEHAIGVPLRELVDSRQLKTRRVPAPELLTARSTHSFGRCLMRHCRHSSWRRPHVRRSIFTGSASSVGSPG